MMSRFVFFVILLFSLTVFGADDISRLESAKKALASSDEIEQFRGYNDCKTIYLRASLNKNSTLAREALEGVIKGGELLGIDVGKYKADLAQLSSSSKQQSTSTPLAQAPKTAVTWSEDALKLSAPAGVKTEENKGLAPGRHRFVEAKWKDSGLELKFDSSLTNQKIRVSKIIESSKQRFRYIIDIDGGRIGTSPVLEHKNLDQIRMAQFDLKTLRLVIEHSKAIAIKTTIKENSLFIDMALETLSKSAPETTTTMIQPVIAPEAPLIAALPPLVNVTPKDRSKKVIVVDPGHGGKDSGATGNGLMEKEIVLNVGEKLAEALRKLGYTVYMTRTNDTFIDLKDRTKFANDKEADLFLSIHANSIPKGADASASYGIETYFLSPGRSERAMRVAAIENSEDMNEMGQYGKLSFLSFLNTEKIIASNKLAIDIQKGVLNNLRKQFPNIKDNGVREAPFWVLVGAQMPAILLEIGYISHTEEAQRISDPKYQAWMVEGIVDGVKHYFANNP